MELLVAEKKNKVDVWFEMWSDVWVGGFFSLLMVLWFVNMNCHMEMHGCVYRYAKPGVGLMLAHRHHPVSTGCQASATHRGVLGLMLGHHLRRWPNTESTVVWCVSFIRVEACLFHCLRARDNCADVDSMLSRRWWRGIGLGSTLARGLVCADVFVVSCDFFLIYPLSACTFIIIIMYCICVIISW